MPRQATQKDVAVRAGVSRVTVSMVLNGKTDGRVPISEETRERVLQAAHALGYSPNPVARMLKHGSNHLIGVFVYEPEFPYDTDNYLFHHLIGAERAAAAVDYNILFFTRNRRHGDPKIYLEGMNSIRLADGTIIMGAQPDRDEIRRLAEEGYPFVCIGRREISGYNIDWVIDDYRLAGEQITRHLIELGHRRIGYVSIGRPIESDEDKLAGCYHALELIPDSNLILLPPEKAPDSAFVLHMVRAEGLTALICADHHMFAALMRASTAAGLQIPTQLSLASITPPTSSVLRDFRIDPTYVQLDRQMVGQLAVNVLVERLQGNSETQHIHVPCRLVVGGTTAPLPTEAD